MGPRDDLYRQARAEYGAALSRVAYGYEADPARRADLLQDIHIELWRSLGAFDGRCSLKTWAYRVAHNVAASHIARERRRAEKLVGLEDLTVDGEAQALRLFEWPAIVSCAAAVLGFCWFGFTSKLRKLEARRDQLPQ